MILPSNIQHLGRVLRPCKYKIKQGKRKRFGLFNKCVKVRALNHRVIFINLNHKKI